MNNAWTGGQYSLLRVALSLFLGVLAALVLIPDLFNQPPDGDLAVPSGTLAISLVPAWFSNPLEVVRQGWLVWLFSACGATCLGLLLVGLHHRFAALVAWYVWLWVLSLSSHANDPGWYLLGSTLLLFAAIPGKPYGSLAAAGRIDPSGGWRFPRPHYGAVWVLLAAACAYSGWLKAESGWVGGETLFISLLTWGVLGFEMLFAPLAMVVAFRPWLWLGMVVAQIFLVVYQAPGLSLGLLGLLAFGFNPGWRKAQPVSAGARVFYDGDCGLCHGAVRFILAEDRNEQLNMAPLYGSTFEQMVPAEQAQNLPDSLVYVDAERGLLTRSSAVFRIMLSLGGLWGIAASLCRHLPSGLCDSFYDQIARIRKQLFATPKAACPLLPTNLRKRMGA